MVSIAVVTSLIGASETERWMILIIALGLIFQSATVIDSHFQANVQSRYVAQPLFIQMLFSSLTKFGLIWLNADLIWFAAVGAADSAVLAIGLLFNYRRIRTVPDAGTIPGTHEGKCHTWHWTADLETAKTLMSDSWPLILAGVAVSLYMRIDLVMIREILDTGAVGQYAAAVRFSEAWYFVPVAITQSFFPAVLHAKNQRLDRYRQRLVWLYGSLAWLGLAVALFVTLLAGPLISFLYGAVYSEAGPVLAAHIWAGIFVCIGVASGKYLLAENLTLIFFWNSAAGAIINIVLNLYLIPRHGIIGAAIATVISYAISGYLMLAIWSKTRGSFLAITRSPVEIFFWRTK